MNSMLVWNNLLAYALQIGMLVGLGGLVPVILRMRVPRARLLYWQVLLVACLALPWIRSWRQEVVAGTVQVSTVITAVASVPVPAHRALPLAQIALWLLLFGIAVRLALLGRGLARVAAYRRRGRTVSSAGLTPGVTLLVSDDVSSPVTFGWRDPVILLPTHFPSLPDEMREAILCHELLHVARRDWLFTIAEELVRAVLWFHPAVWWVIGEIQLAREQTVDQAVIETTRARDPYVDALLLMAGAGVSGTPQLDLAPAPMFLRRRHLKRRLMEVMKEVRMSTISKTRLTCVMCAAVITVGAVCWLATGAFPLAAAPQTVNDAAGVAVNLNGSPLMHRSPVAYPPEALAKGVEGTVVVQVKLDASGEVSDATVLSGPDELRKAALQSVLTWHFDKSAALSRRTVNIDFVKPANSTTAAETTQLTQQLQQMQRKALPANAAGMPAPPPPPPPPPPTSGKLDHIVVTGLSDSARSELLSSLPIQEGGEWTGQMFKAVREATSKFDSHLSVGLAQSGGELTLNISAPNSGFIARPTSGGFGFAGGVGATSAAAPSASGVYSVGNGVSPPSVLSKIDPVYPEGEPAGTSATVLLSIVVGTDGMAENINVVKSADPSFDANAIAAVQQWQFRPGTMNGVPVKVKAQIEVNFRKL